MDGQGAIHPPLVSDALSGTKAIPHASGLGNVRGLRVRTACGSMERSRRPRRQAMGAFESLLKCDYLDSPEKVGGFTLRLISRNVNLSTLSGEDECQ